MDPTNRVNCRALKKEIFLNSHQIYYDHVAQCVTKMVFLCLQIYDLFWDGNESERSMGSMPAVSVITSHRQETSSPI